MIHLFSVCYYARFDRTQGAALRPLCTAAPCTGARKPRADASAARDLRPPALRPIEPNIINITKLSNII